MPRIQPGNGPGKPFLFDITLHGSIADSRAISCGEGEATLEIW
jgi:hypothetical protein